MNKRVALVLGLTFGALVAATVWVPTVLALSSLRAPLGIETLHWRWVTTTETWRRLTPDSPERLLE